jgi:putative transposase
MTRQSWIDKTDPVPIIKQCMLVGVSRATLYAQKQARPSDDDLVISRLIDEEFTKFPFYGSRKMVVRLQAMGHKVNRKRVQRLMQTMCLTAMAPGPKTSRPNKEHKIYPYLLRDVPVVKPNQVWSTDITYIRLAHGFAYLVAIIDWYSRKVLSWRLSNTMEATFCVDCLEDALRMHGRPEIFNSDQGSQFTSADFIDVLKRENITISMDGRGRVFDNIFVERLWRNVKYEDIYLYDYTTMRQLTSGLSKYFVLYNSERPHQSLGYRTPDVVYHSASGGGAIIVEKFGGSKKKKASEKTGKTETEGQELSDLCELTNAA